VRSNVKKATCLASVPNAVYLQQANQQGKARAQLSYVLPGKEEKHKTGKTLRYVLQRKLKFKLQGIKKYKFHFLSLKARIMLPKMEFHLKMLQFPV